jgi:hypothetical protein
MNPGVGVVGVRRPARQRRHHLFVSEGWPVALAGADEVQLDLALVELAELEEGHALVRFACAVALYGFELATGLEHGPFDQGRAARFARALLMPGGVPRRRRRGRRRAGRALRRADRAGPRPRGELRSRANGVSPAPD